MPIDPFKTYYGIISREEDGPKLWEDAHDSPEDAKATVGVVSSIRRNRGKDFFIAQMRLTSHWRDGVEITNTEGAKNDD